MKAHSINTIICPSCGADVTPTVPRCTRCGAAMGGSRDIQPVSASPPERVIDRPWILVVLLLHVGLLGIPVYWQTKYSVQTRLAIIAVSIVYTVVAVAVIYWGFLQLFRLIQLMST